MSSWSFLYSSWTLECGLWTWGRARRRDTCYLSGAFTQVKQLAGALAKCQGSEEGEVTIQLFKKLSLTLMRGNALLLFTRGQDAEVDGVE